jgi:hypothetical protein
MLQVLAVGPGAYPSLDEVLGARGEQGAELERWLSTVTPDELSTPRPAAEIRVG